MKTQTIPQVRSLGFTGTREGMTDAQSDEVAGLLAALNPKETHSGDCCGSDVQFLDLVEYICPEAVTYCHPSTLYATRAFCLYNHVYRPMLPLLRNRVMAVRSDLLIATPKEQSEQLRSGTWATVRYALDLYRKVLVVYPSGKVSIR